MAAVVTAPGEFLAIGALRQLEMPPKGIKVPSPKKVKVSMPKKKPASDLVPRTYSKSWSTTYLGPLGGQWKLVGLSWDASTGQVTERWEKAP